MVYRGKLWYIYMFLIFAEQLDMYLSFDVELFALLYFYKLHNHILHVE